MSAEGVLVTGAAGFIGSHTCEALLARGARVVGLDNFDPYYAEAVKRANVAAVQRTAGERGAAFRLVEGDIRDLERVEALLREEELGAVIHLAAKAGVRPSLEDPLAYVRVNVEGTAAVLEAARRCGVGRVVFGSSSSVYGNAGAGSFAEDHPVNEPISPYAATKVAGERLAYSWHHLYGLPVVCLRFFTVYGPRQRPDLAINKFARLIAAGETLPRYGDGTTQRDYTFVGDIVRGILAALDSELEWEILNLGSGNPVTLNRLIAALEQALGREARIEQLPAQPGDVDRTHAEIGKARRLLGWEPEVRLEEGLAAFVAWWREAGGQ